MKIALAENAAIAFMGPGRPILEPLGQGLIHHTYKASQEPQQKKIVLQAINTSVFNNPADIIYNYWETFEYLQKLENVARIPAPLKTTTGQLLWRDTENNYWRATEFVEHSYSPLVAEKEEEAYTVSKSFGAFTRSLVGINARKLKVIIPDFHNLSFRYRQFEEAVSRGLEDRISKSTQYISCLRERKSLLEFFESLSDTEKYPLRLMHHDCKISNILFDLQTGQVISPVDLDTLMPGKFISDLGDMIRTMACSVDENCVEWKSIQIRSSFYHSILEGYMEGIGAILTKEEKINIHFPGLILIYMQALRFLTDFLQDDKYYKTTYAEQNLNRAINQLILLEKLEEFLDKKYSTKLRNYPSVCPPAK